jgi:putative copper export protein
MIYALLFALLLVGHAVADYWLQPGWLSVMKHRPEGRWHALAVHGACHALPVAIVTGLPALALAEWVLHPLIDYLKSRGWYGMKTDQALHVLCKLAWVGVLALLAAGCSTNPARTTCERHSPPWHTAECPRSP